MEHTLRLPESNGHKFLQVIPVLLSHSIVYHCLLSSQRMGNSK